MKGEPWQPSSPAHLLQKINLAVSKGLWGQGGLRFASSADHGRWRSRDACARLIEFLWAGEELRYPPA